MRCSHHSLFVMLLSCCCTLSPKQRLARRFANHRVAACQYPFSFELAALVALAIPFPAARSLPFSNFYNAQLLHSTTPSILSHHLYTMSITHMLLIYFFLHSPTVPSHVLLLTNRLIFLTTLVCDYSTTSYLSELLPSNELLELLLDSRLLFVVPIRVHRC